MYPPPPVQTSANLPPPQTFDLVEVSGGEDNDEEPANDEEDFAPGDGIPTNEYQEVTAANNACYPKVFLPYFLS